MEIFDYPSCQYLRPAAHYCCAPSDLHGSLPSWVKPIQLSVGWRPSPNEPLLILGNGDKEAHVQPPNAATPLIGSPSAYLRKATVYMWDGPNLATNANCNQVYAGGYGCSDEASEGNATNRDMQF